jgi:membrane complex biogenesis BtpA family protein
LTEVPVSSATHVADSGRLMGSCGGATPLVPGRGGFGGEFNIATYGTRVAPSTAAPEFSPARTDGNLSATGLHGAPPTVRHTPAVRESRFVLDVFDADQPVIGMVHLPALPGAPEFGGDREAILDSARRDARRLTAGGVDGVMVENFEDAPFYPDDVPKHVVASMTRATREVVETVDVPVGVNVLRNDTTADLAVAQATGARFVRANVHTGARVTDQGIVEGKAHETVRLRDRLDYDVRLLADHDVKHSAPLAAHEYNAESMADGVERGLADAMVISGVGTGRGVDLDALESAVERRDEWDLDVPILVGSGVTADTVGEILRLADGVIVGTSLKEDGDVGNPVSEARVAELVTAARS